MSGELPGVDPEVLHGATVTFGEAADALSRMQAEESVGDAAFAVGDLRIAESCRKAQDGIDAVLSAAVASVREFSESLDAAANAYSTSEQAVADDIAGVDIPT